MSLNRVTLLGNVGKDPDVKHLENNNCVAQFSLATTKKGYTTKEGQTVADRTEWHSLVVWNKLAEVVEKFVKKGDKLYVEGELRYRSYDDQNGVKRYVTEIYVENMEMLTPKADNKPLPPMPDAPAGGSAFNDEPEDEPPF